MKHDFSKFQHCLRMQITPDEYADERIENVVSCCKEYGYTNVMLLTTGEEFFLGHLTVEEVKPWVEVAKKAARILRENGITVSLHHWIGVGHLDRGVSLKENQHFTTMVDFNGRRATSVVCPTDEKWQAHFASLIGYMVKEIRPEFYWVEDDFRLHNHFPLEWGGCFCEKHVKRFNARLGTNYTREEFCKKAFQKGEPTKERKAWLDESRNTMLEFATLIHKVVKDANPSTGVALMSSFPEEHCLEARDWTGIFNALNEDEHLNRIHLPGYFERSGKEYMYDFNAVSMAIRAFSPEDTKILPEMENGSTTEFRKSARFLAFQLEAATPLCLSGMTYNIYDLVGNGVVKEYRFEDEKVRLTPYLQAVMESGAEYKTLRGVVVPIDEKIVYKKKIERNFYDLKTNLFNTAAYASALGLSYRYSKEKNFVGETVFLFGDAVYIFTDEQLRALFENNSVVVDGGAVLLLKERNLLSLIGATDARLYPAETGYQIYEQIEGERKIYGIGGFRASCRNAAGDFVKIDYQTEEGLQTLSHVYNAQGTIKWNSFARKGNVLINPFVVDKKLHTQFSELRRLFVSEFVEEKTGVLLDTRFEGLHPYLYQGEEQSVVMLVNATLENFEKTEFFLKGVEFDKILSVDKDGQTREVSYEKKGDVLCIDKAFPYMSSVTLKLIKK